MKKPKESAKRPAASSRAEQRAAYRDMDRLIASIGRMTSHAYRRERLRVWSCFLDTLHESDYPTPLAMLAFQLAWTRKALVRNGWVRDCHKSAAEIRAVETLLARVMDEDGYAQRIVKPVEARFAARYGRRRMVFVPCEGRDTKRLVLKFGKHDASRLPGVTAVIHRAYLKAEATRQADLARACRLLARNVRHWWD